MADRIEKLIVDGQQEVLTAINRLGSEMQNMRADMRGMDLNIRTLDQKIDRAHDSLKKEIHVTSSALDYEIKEVGRKLDLHIKLPAHT
ncbi:MAG: hypothetical protein MUC35_03870 [Candidatus Margulisbacteria bacterium]|nr:hypothetical protein [Candidatus Margulisiibacteriota bacterium]